MQEETGTMVSLDTLDRLMESEAETPAEIHREGTEAVEGDESEASAPTEASLDTLDRLMADPKVGELGPNPNPTPPSTPMHTRAGMNPDDDKTPTPPAPPLVGCHTSATNSTQCRRIE